jgi:glutathione S-transferase
MTTQPADKRFVLYGSPHSLPTYKVALLLSMCAQPFSFRYVSFQKGVHKEAWFAALSRWQQVPVLVDRGIAHSQSAAIVEHVSASLGRFGGRDAAARQAVREWLYWNVDALFPPVFIGYGVELGRRKLLPISFEPAVEAYHLKRAETALGVLDAHVGVDRYICDVEPTIADLFCLGDIAFAEICHMEIGRWPNVAAWAGRMRALPGYRPPFELLAMKDLEFD